MITAALIFAFGFLLALLIALVLAPLVWKRARSIARQEFEATIPASANEIRGTYDQMRARTIFEASRREMQAEERERRAAFERAEAGRISNENAELTARARALAEQVEQQVAELEDLNAALSRREEEADEVDRELRDVHRDLRGRIEEVEELGMRFEEMRDIADERKIRIITLETQNEELTEALRRMERRSLGGVSPARSERSEHRQPKAAPLEATAVAEHAGRPTLVENSKSIPAETAGPHGPQGPEPVRLDPAADFGSLETISDPDRLREEIADLAARVIDLTARREGPSSPIEAILSAARETPAGEGGLAGRVAALRRERQRDAAE